MDYEKWLRELELKHGGAYEYAQCPYLQKGRCSIYERRFNCCRNVPQKTGFCASAKECALSKQSSIKNTREGSDVCAQCANNCCKRILVPKGIEITKRFIAKWMNVDCATCCKIFK